LLYVIIVLAVIVAVATTGLYLYLMELWYAAAQLDWEHERFVFVAEVFQAVSMVKLHKFGKGRYYEGRFGPNGPGGHVALTFEGTELNYGTLADMVMLEHKQQELLVVAIDHLKLYELENPQPNPPTYFGKRLKVGLNAKHYQSRSRWAQRPNLEFADGREGAD
jgi:hypothetical protein